MIHAKKILSLTLMGIMIFPVMSLSLVSAQNTNDQLINNIIGDLGPVRGYASADKTLVQVVSKTNNTATLEAPVAKQNGQTVTKYYITWAPFPYSAMTDGTATNDDLPKIKDSEDLEKETGTPIYEVQGEKLVFTISIDDPNVPIYVSIVPADANKQSGNPIEDVVFTLSTVSVGSTTTATTAVAGDVTNININKAIVGESCIWDATANRVTLVWDLNLAMSNATRVEISHRGDENVGPMVVKGTPPITNRTFVVDTSHRNVQLFRFKPLDSAGTMVGEEIPYSCKPATTKPDPVKPTDPAKPIPVVPETGPAQTVLIIFIATLVMYIVYRRVKA